MVEPSYGTRARGLTTQAGQSQASHEAVTEALVLRSLPGIGPVRFHRLVQRFGTPGAALLASSEAFSAVAGGAAAAARANTDVWDRAEALQDRCRKSGIQVLLTHDPAYPEGLNDLVDPPPVLFVRGNLKALGGRSVSMVGSRRASAYGRRVARTLARTLVESGFSVISGMALGIDAASHEGALGVSSTDTNGRKTVAVLGAGVDVPSPAQHRDLYQRIVAEGAVISELDPGTAPVAHHFPRRNRIIAAMSRRVIVVEAAIRSGALITAHVALDLGRDVYAVPGPLGRPSAIGSNRLVADGAGLVLDPLELPWDERIAEAQVETAGPLTHEFGALLEVLDTEPRTVEYLASRTNRPLAEISAALVRLELQGTARRTLDGCYAAAVGPGGSGE